MAPPGRRAFVELLRRVAAENGLEFLALSSDWIVQIREKASGRVCNVFGYTFDLNPAGAVDICREKAATSLVLESHGVQNVPHSVFLNPAHALAGDYVPRTGIWADVQKLVGEAGFPVVLKPLKGTGGLDVMKATCWREVEAAVQLIFSKEYGLAVSPYKEIVDEYRCFCLEGKVELVYRKIRSSVSGDGTSTVAALLGRLFCADGSSGRALSSLAKAAASLSPEDLARVPAAGEVVPVQWRHNLGQGSSACLEVPEETRRRLEEFAPRAAAAVGVRFCSIDVVEVAKEGLMVMEINSGVMMDSLMEQLGEQGEALAHRLYSTAVLRSLGRPA